MKDAMIDDTNECELDIATADTQPPPAATADTEPPTMAPTYPAPRGPVVRTCACGRSYTAHAWKTLPKVGYHRDWIEKLELRNCVCRSTIAIVKRRYTRERAPYGALKKILLARLTYGGRKGRAAERRLRAMGCLR